MGLRQNLELKARYGDLDAGRRRALELGAVEGGVELQTDTYFRAPHGRLKLREIEGQPAVLIAYSRPNQCQVRQSDYFLVPAPDPLTLKGALAAALGVRGLVKKRREILHWHNVRIHLDEVDPLGRFVELEAVLGPTESADRAHDRLDKLCQALGIDRADTLAGSYADLLGL